MPPSYAMGSVSYRPVAQTDLDEAIRIETAAYPEEEAASLEAFKARRASAPHLFQGAFLQVPNESDKLIGYICATLSDKETFTHDSMSTHVPAGKSICVHSVCIDPQYHRRGFGLELLKYYLNLVHQLSAQLKGERVLLLAHEELIPFYSKAGFELVGISDVAHGSKPWFEMSVLIPDIPPPAPDQDLQLKIMQALREQNSQGSGQNTSKPEKTTWLSFSGDATQAANGDKSNKFDLICPRPDCNSIILKPGCSTLVERPNIVLDNPSQLPPPDLLPPASAPGLSMSAWKIGPPANPMVFENVGFSRDIPAALIPSGDHSVVKLLTCAECDLGPLGWCEQGTDGMSYWLVCDRVAYR